MWARLPLHPRRKGGAHHETPHLCPDRGILLGEVTLTAAENPSGYVFTLPLHCERGDESRDFTLTGYAAFHDERLAALSLDDPDALERWLIGA